MRTHWSASLGAGLRGTKTCSHQRPVRGAPRRTDDRDGGAPQVRRRRRTAATDGRTLRLRVRGGRPSRLVVCRSPPSVVFARPSRRSVRRGSSFVAAAHLRDARGTPADDRARWETATDGTRSEARTARHPQRGTRSGCGTQSLRQPPTGGSLPEQQRNTKGVQQEQCALLDGRGMERGRPGVEGRVGPEIIQSAVNHAGPVRHFNPRGQRTAVVGAQQDLPRERPLRLPQVGHGRHLVAAEAWDTHGQRCAACTWTSTQSPWRACSTGGTGREGGATCRLGPPCPAAPVAGHWKGFRSCDPTPVNGGGSCLAKDRS